MSEKNEKGPGRQTTPHVLVDAVDGTKIYLPIGERFSLKEYADRCTDPSLRGRE